jgi:hypothetical protein
VDLDDLEGFVHRGDENRRGTSSQGLAATPVRPNRELFNRQLAGLRLSVFGRGSIPNNPGVAGSASIMT